MPPCAVVNHHGHQLEQAGYEVKKGGIAEVHTIDVEYDPESLRISLIDGQNGSYIGEECIKLSDSAYKKITSVEIVNKLLLN